MEAKQDIPKWRTMFNEQISKILEYWQKNGFSYELNQMRQQAKSFASYFAEEDANNDCCGSADHGHLVDMGETLLERNQHEYALIFSILSCCLNPQQSPEDIDIYDNACHVILFTVENSYALNRPERVHLKEKAVCWLGYFLVDIKASPSCTFYKCLLVMCLSVYMAAIHKLDGNRGANKFRNTVLACHHYVASLYQELQAGDVEELRSHDIFSWFSRYQRDIFAEGSVRGQMMMVRGLMQR